MKRFNRKATLSRLDSSIDWTTVKAWIKFMVTREPVIMSRVAKATFSDMAQWIVSGSDNIEDACGCLVGTTAIELVKERNSFVLEDSGFGDNVLTRDGESFNAFEVVPQLCRRVDPAIVKRLQRDAEDVGMLAFAVAGDIGQDEAVALFKSEINVQLRARAKRLSARRKAAHKRNAK